MARNTMDRPSLPIFGLRGHIKSGCSGEGGLRPTPIPPGGSIEVEPLPPPPTTAALGSILVPKDVAPMIPGGDSPPELPFPPLPPERPLRGFVAVAPITGPIPRPIPVVPRPPVEPWN